MSSYSAMAETGREGEGVEGAHTGNERGRPGLRCVEKKGSGDA